MTGLDIYNTKIKNRIEQIAKKKSYLQGIINYLMIDKSLNTVERYIGTIDDFLQYINKKESELKSIDFISYLNYVKYKNETEKESITMITKYHALKNYGAYLKQAEILSINPMEDVKRPKHKESQKSIQKREIGYLNKEEIRKVIDSIKDGVGTSKAKTCQKKMKERDLAIIVLFLTTGIRVSGMIKLDVSDIHLSDNTMTLTEKGGVVRVYQLSQQTMSVLIDWLIKREEILKGKEEDALFLNQYNNRMQYDGLKEIVTKYTINIEGKHITPHKLRATYGTQLYEATKDIYFVQKAMGHSSPTTTERYIRGQHDTTKKASDIMESLL